MASTSTTMTTSVAATVVIAGLILVPAIALAQQVPQGQSSGITARAAEKNDSASSEIKARLARMKEQAPNTSLIIYPVLVNQSKQTKMWDFVRGVAEAMALFFERAGVKKIDVSEEVFCPSDFDDVWTISREFGRFVRDKRVEADYAVFAEFIGTPNTGLDKIFTVVVDKAGDPVWVDTQVRTDPLVKSVNQHTPFTASYLSVEKLRRHLNLTDPTGKDAVQGKWSKHFDEKARRRAPEQEDLPKK